MPQDITVQIASGDTLHFPLGTSKTVIDRIVKQHVQSGPVVKGMERVSQRDPSLLTKAEDVGVKSLPYVGGIAGGAVGGIPGAALGGGAGEAGRQLIQRARGKPTPSTSVEAGKEIAESAGGQALYEAGGKYIFGPVLKGVARLLKPAAGKVAGEIVAPAAVRATGREIGLSSAEIAGETSMGRIGRGLQTMGEVSVSGQAIAQSAKARMLDEGQRLADEALAKIAEPREPAIAGAQVKSGLEIARDTFRARGEVYYSGLSKLGENVEGNAKPIIAEAKKLSGEIPKPLRRGGFEAVSRGGQIVSDVSFEDLPESVRTAIESVGGAGRAMPQASNSERILSVMTSIKPNATFNELMAAKRWLDQFLPGLGNGLADKEAQSLSKHFEGLLYDALSDAAEKQGGELKPAWIQARNFWRTGRQSYDNKVVLGMFTHNPEDLVKGIQPGDVTDINAIKKVLLGHGGLTEAGGVQGEKYATGTQPKRAWDIFRRQYMQSKLLEDPGKAGLDLETLRGLKTKLNTVGESQLKAIFNTDMKGREVLENIRVLAETTSRIKPVYSSPWRRVTEFLGLGTGLMFGRTGASALEGAATFEAGTSGISAILYNKTATRLLTRGLELSSKGSEEGTALVMRAIGLATKVDLTKPVTVKEPQ